MKKVKYIALALVLCLGLIGGAYAWWTDTLEVRGTVDTGEFNIGYTYGSGGAASANLNNLPEYTTGSAERIDEKSIKYTISGLYPQKENRSEAVQLGIRMDNNGTIPGIVESVDFETCGNEVWDYVRAHMSIRGSGGIDSARTYSHPNDHLGLSNSERTGFNFNELDYWLEKAFEDQVLNPGSMVRFGVEDEDSSIVFWLDADAMEADEKGNAFQNLEDLSFTITFNWVQWNKE